jgi:hypothetical protein
MDENQVINLIRENLRIEIVRECENDGTYLTVKLLFQGETIGSDYLKIDERD